MSEQLKFLTLTRHDGHGEKVTVNVDEISSIHYSRASFGYCSASTVLYMKNGHRIEVADSIEVVQRLVGAREA